MFRLRESKIFSFILLQGVNFAESTGLRLAASTVFYGCWTKQGKVLTREVATVFQRNWCCWKISLLDIAGCRLAPPRHPSRDWEMDSCGIFPDQLQVKYVPCTSRCSLAAWFKEILSSYGTRHDALPFSNRYTHWLNFCKDPGFCPKLNGANGIFFLLNEFWISSCTFRFRVVIPWLFCLLAKLFNSFPL